MRILYADTEILNDKDIYLSWLSQMPVERQERIDRFRFDKDKQLSLGAGILLYTVLEEVGIDYSSVRLERGKNEKPFLPDYPDIHFNLSHSGQRVMCVLSNSPVGCDVQKKKESDLKVARRFFTPEEVQFIEKGNGIEEQSYRFCRLWTLKESYIKATGRGLSMPLDSFSICIDENTGKAASVDDYHFSEFQIEEDYCYSVCMLASKGQNGLCEDAKIDKIIFRQFEF